MADVLRELGPVFLGSRLKRLADRLQADAGDIIRSSGLPVQPAHFPLMAALDRDGPMTVTDAVAVLGVSQPTVTRTAAGLIELGLIASTREGADQRHKTLTLTSEGVDVIRRARNLIWPRVEAAVIDMCDGDVQLVLDAITRMEDALDRSSLSQRVGNLRPFDPTSSLRIREFSDELAPVFHDLNAEWIERMFTLEDVDRDVLSNPRERIVDKGGVILFVEAGDLGVVGAGALKPVGDGSVELTKMAVAPAAQGRKAGEFLLRALLARAVEAGFDRLHLLTNQRCASAIHLYEKLGFVHDEEIMKAYGAGYDRCDVAMSYRPDRPTAP